MSEEVKIKYDEIKKKKTHRYCVFFIKDEKLIAVEKMAPRDANYEEFWGDLMACGPEDCRYGLYDFEYEHQCQVNYFCPKLLCLQNPFEFILILKLSFKI